MKLKIFIIFNSLALYYLLTPTPIILDLPNSLKSIEPGDTIQIPNVKAFYNNQADPPKKSNIQVVPLNWDQRHTVNISVSYNHPRFIGVGLIGQFQSGLPYTPAIQNMESTFENSGRKPFNYNVDLRIFRKFTIWNIKYGFFVKVYNLFDRKNEIDVYSDTGRAGYSLVSQYIGERRGHVNTLEEWLIRQDYYAEPRKIFLGFDIEI